MKRTYDARRGQSLVEFALILPVLSLLMLGAIDLGRVYYTKATLANASRAAAAYAANHQIVETLYGGDETAATEGVRQVARAEAGGVSLSNVAVDTTWDPGATYTVTAATQWSAVTPLISALWGGGPLPLQHSTALRHNCAADRPCAYPVPLACSAIAISSGPTLSLTNMSDHPHTATITWTASQAGSARVEYSGPEGTGAVGAGSTANHNASFVFSAGGTYTYTIIMANLCGQTYVWSGSFTH